MDFYYHHHFLNHSISSSGFSSFWGAFAGAFFAFIFGLITYIITKRRERFVQHKNALVLLERALNKHLNDFGALEVLIKGMQNILGQGKVDITRLFHVEIPEKLDIDLASIDLINKFFMYQISIDRLNFNMDSINRALTRIEDLFINGHGVVPENFALVQRLLTGLIGDLPKMDERTKRFLVLVRIHNKRVKNKNSFVYGVFNSLWDHEISKEEIKTERERLDKEIQDILKQDPSDMF
ncbi:MAG: hypothetical protein HKM07_05740 [Chlamydiae bacterium]|nr:hypothetical protein [Chlamydiota bacterium]